MLVKLHCNVNSGSVSSSPHPPLSALIVFVVFDEKWAVVISACSWPTSTKTTILVNKQHMCRVGPERIPDQRILETMKLEIGAWVDAEYVPSTF